MDAKKKNLWRRMGERNLRILRGEEEYTGTIDPRCFLDNLRNLPQKEISLSEIGTSEDELAKFEKELVANEETLKKEGIS